MKRDQQNLGKEKEMNSNKYSYSGAGSGSSSMPNGKGKMWDEAGTETHLQDAGVDELLYALGYKVKSSDMAEVAQKIEQLEEFIGNVQDNGFSNLGSETVHYNPSDLFSWLEAMISEINPPIDGSSCNFDSSTVTSLDNSCSTLNSNFTNPPVVFEDSSFDSDLTAIPGGRIVYPYIQQPHQSASPVAFMVQPPSKRMRPNSQLSMWGVPNNSIMNSGMGVESIRPVVLVDSQENGIRLVHALMACAEAIQQENMKLAEVLVKQIGILAVSQAGSMRKVATYFAEALARRIYRLFPISPNDTAYNNMLQMHFYETCPYLKFSHFTANQAILEAFVGKSRVHVIDFSMKQGMQWPALLQALALRPGGPPSFRLTGIGFGPPSTDHLQEVGWKLSQLAETINVQFEFSGCVVNSLADLDASMFDIRENETVAVNSIFELHQLLAKPGAIESVLSVVRELKPEILTVVEQEANHNGQVFLNRFTESLHYYSAMFDSLESSNCGGIDGGSIVGCDITDHDKAMSEVYLGRQICNLIAREGLDRVERHETLTQWRTRFNSAGFAPVHIGSNAYKQASMLLALFAGGDGYKVEENEGCLMLGWHTRPLIATSAWKLN